MPDRHPLLLAAHELRTQLIEDRRSIHAYPELAYQEERTAALVVKRLDALGIPYEAGIGGTGVVGVIRGPLAGPTVLLRADMDALPIHEETGLPFASTRPGAMHACGHDIHATTLLGVAALLKDLAPQLAGRVALVFQPAEEVLEGAAAMIRDGAGQGIDLALGFHNHPEMPVGRFGYVRGAALAASDRFDLIVHGRSGHAAHPYAAIDPIVAAAAFVSDVQTVVSREIRPTHPAVVTVGSFQGGTTYNIIPERVHLKGTVRTLHDESRATAEAAIRRLAAGLEIGMRVRCELDYRALVPPLVNDDRVLEPAVAAVRRQFGDVIEEGEPSMGSEDFSQFAALAPAFQLRIGSGAPGRDDRLHNARYQPDERCIALGVQALTRAALDLLA